MRNLYRPILIIITTVCLLPTIAYAQLFDAEDGVRFRIEPVAQDLGVVWALAFISEDELMFTERRGTINTLNLATGEVTRLGGVPDIYASGQGGMLDIALPPGYQRGDYLYIVYSKELDGQGVTVLARARLDGQSFEQWEELLVTESASSTGRHYGSRIVFDGEGHLFFSVGDRGVRENGQDLTTHAGTIVRLHLDGSVPADNPFVNQPDALPEIWSYGHRNPQGMVYDTANNRFWAIEHGPRGGDELNLILPGLNYGWAVISHGKEYWGPMRVGEATSRPGYEDPRKIYTPSIAPGSLLLYEGAAFPTWDGNLLVGALKLRHINRIVLDEDGMPVHEERLLESLNERIRALAADSRGNVYFSTDSGTIMRMVPEV
ncbi:MAG: PQQ-dependent sugar dehydrogenase [Desulfofustis sp. PB-SRB1]|jgi:glucose/arabinose dehydrogenase|nr:PQQ-dependent sugar dehydrogenase [Desulfofustis sp. PB-SRB1]MBM1002594.1 PQQ-dependent sugar dehydrogenase [Desulfofustis sp. PB-SRB1]HBH30213.1 PQQ-dependent sugar dehydrogenase [Desulfofustis sp.]HBH32426.1 PQQ-dependent sugar dehydrogenase [Desulfofustis sp.]